MGRARSHSYRVLVIEDDEAFAESLAQLFEDDDRIELAGTAPDAERGIALVETLGPDVVLMDIELPGMDGVEATRRIRRRHPDLPVVAMTGWEYEERALEVRHAGAADFVPKGRLEPDLVDVLLSAVAAKAGRR
jgi:DNA-binding NarL/FixJ family response regulator